MGLNIDPHVLWSPDDFLLVQNTNLMCDMKFHETQNRHDVQRKLTLIFPICLCFQEGIWGSLQKIQKKRKLMMNVKKRYNSSSRIG